MFADILQIAFPFFKCFESKKRKMNVDEHYGNSSVEIYIGRWVGRFDSFTLMNSNNLYWNSEYDKENAAVVTI